MTIQITPVLMHAPMISPKAGRLELGDELASAMIEKMGLCYNDNGRTVYQAFLHESEALPVAVVIADGYMTFMASPTQEEHVRMLVGWINTLMASGDIVDTNAREFLDQMKGTL